MAEASSFALSYHGPDVDNGAMDVQDIGPTLLAIGTLFNEANSELNEESVKINVNITATSANSFNIDLSVVQSVMEKVVGLFTTSELTTAAIIAILFGTNGLSWLIKKIRGRKIEKADRIKPAGKYKMSFSDGSSIEIDESVMKLFKNRRILEAITQIVSPVAKDGIEKLRVKCPDANVDEYITRADLNSFTRIQLPGIPITMDVIEVDLRSRLAHFQG